MNLSVKILWHIPLILKKIPQLIIRAFYPMELKKIENFERALVTGGAGFIGTSLIETLSENSVNICTIDKLTYASDADFVANVPNHQLVVTDICNRFKISEIVNTFKPEVVFHLAAESHVDRSISNPDVFLETNVIGTQVMVDVCTNYFQKAKTKLKENFRFIHISTDEVFGSLGPTGAFDEQSQIQPNSPYSASKAASDHIVRAWNKTYGLPVCITNCSNNYGPRQHDEKLIPTIIRNALCDKPIPIYGNGKNVRDWLYVKDHVNALITVAQKGKIGARYCVGGGQELQNIDIVQLICKILDELAPRADGKLYFNQVEFVKDRLGHDFRYAIDGYKLKTELGWKPRYNFEDGIRETVKWYLSKY